MTPRSPLSPFASNPEVFQSDILEFQVVQPPTSHEVNDIALQGLLRNREDQTVDSDITITVQAAGSNETAEMNLDIKALRRKHNGLQFVTVLGRNTLSFLEGNLVNLYTGDDPAAPATISVVRA